MVTDIPARSHKAVGGDGSTGRWAGPAAFRRGRRARPRLGGRTWEALGTQLFLVPIAIVFVVLYVIPLAQSVYYSFTDYSAFSQTKHLVGLKNYTAIFSDSTLLAGLEFTLLYAVATTLAVTLIAIPLAVVLNRRFAGRNFVRAAFFFPAVPSMAVLGLVWTFIFSPLSSGVINSVIGTLFGVGPVPWLSDSLLAKVSVVIVGVWAQAGWHAVLYLAYLQSIPREYYEASTVDGASSRQQFFRITLPLLAPAMTVSQFLLLVAGLRVYDLPFTLTKGGPGYATYTLTQVIIERGISQGYYGVGSALGVVFLLAVALVVAIQLSITHWLERRVQQ
jgi:raffinose/stachyose/melibiose transport system permease protein